MKKFILIACFMAISAPSSVFAASAKELLREHVFTYTAAATTLRLCQDARWSREHDEASYRIVADQIATMGLDSAESEKIAQQYLDGEIDADLFDYYKARGIRRFLWIPKEELGVGHVYNASPYRIYNESLGKYEYPAEQEFCDLAEREMKADSAVGKYFTASSAIAKTVSERLELAKAFATFATENMDIGAAVVGIMLPQIIESIEASGKTVTTAQKKKISILLKETYVPKMRVFLVDQIPFVAETFSANEIRALIANKPLNEFIKTEDGRNIMERLPLLHERQRFHVQKMRNDTIGTIMPKIQKIIEQ